MDSPKSFTSTVSEWTIFKPAPHECGACHRCTCNAPFCPTYFHLYNYEGDFGLECYMCSACSHNDGEPNLPPSRYVSKSFVWYVHIAVDEVSNSELFTYRLALAQLENGEKTTYYTKEEDVPDGGMVIPVYMKKSAEVRFVQMMAREKVKQRLRELRHLYEFEMHLERLQIGEGIEVAMEDLNLMEGESKNETDGKEMDETE